MSTVTEAHAGRDGSRLPFDTVLWVFPDPPDYPLAIIQHFITRPLGLHRTL